MNITHLLTETPAADIQLHAVETSLGNTSAEPVVAVVQNGKILMKLGLADLKRLELARLEAYHSNTIPDFE